MKLHPILVCFAGLLSCVTLHAASQNITVTTQNSAASISGKPGSLTLGLSSGVNLVLRFDPVVMAPDSELIVSGEIVATEPTTFTSGGHFRVGILDSNLRGGRDYGWLGYTASSWGIPKTRLSGGYFASRNMPNNGTWESVSRPGEQFMTVLSSSVIPESPVAKVERYGFEMKLAYDGAKMNYLFTVYPAGQPATLVSCYAGVDTQVNTSAFDRLGFYITPTKKSASGFTIDKFGLVYRKK
jgi:hypothetical protein